jgi:hypothetical protein
MRFVPIKSVEQQSALMLHRTRDLVYTDNLNPHVVVMKAAEDRT